MVPEGPVDVERQCGVLIKEGVYCARSLTCKSHSMGAKRAVLRSLPYDMLLAAYQKKNQAKQQRAAIDANAPLEDEEAANGPVDSDEELNAVMHGLSNWNPQPVVPPIVRMPIDREYQKKRLYEQLHNATNGFTINICKVVGYGAQKLAVDHPAFGEGEGDADGEVDTGTAGGLGQGMSGVAQRRASQFQMQQPPSRRASVVSQR
jgi:SAGA-associated factor 73